MNGADCVIWSGGVGCSIESKPGARTPTVEQLWTELCSSICPRGEFMSTLTFYRRVIDETGETNREAVKLGTAAVFHALRDRLTREEAGQAVAQLPRDLKRVWEEGDAPGRKPVKLNRKEFYDRVKREAGLASVREARFVTIGVFTALKAQLSPGEVDDIWAQLPRDLKEIWEAA